MRSRLAFAWVASLLVGGCGLLIGLEDRELPLDGTDSGTDGTTPVVDGSKIDTGSDAPVNDGSPTDTGIDAPQDAGPDVGDGDACACANGCNAEGICLDEIVSIGMGRLHACALRGDGKIFCIGGNQFHQLATNATALSEVWRAVSVTNGVTEVLFKEIGVGPLSNCAISRDGDLYCWGGNAFLQLAQPGGGTIVTPTKVDLGALKVKAVSVGTQATCAITDAAGAAPNVRCWGHSSSGDLGVGFDTTDGGDAGAYSFSTPQIVKDLRAKAIHVLDSDADEVGRACAISETGDLPFCWGATPNNEITTAVPSTTCDPTGSGPFPCYFEPTAWGANASRDIGNGLKEVCALELADAGNKIRCRGSAGVNAQDNTCSAPNTGFLVTVPDGGGNPVRLGSGPTARCYINETSDVYCFGSNATFHMAREGSDSCGASTVDRRTAEPLRVTFFPDGGNPSSGEGVPVKAKLIAVGRQGVIVYTTDKKIVGWGANMEGSLGTRGSPDAEAPSCSQVDGRCQGPTIIAPPVFP